MGCDAYADEKGTFELVITQYAKDGRELARIYLRELDPGEELSIEILRGKER